MRKIGLIGGVTSNLGSVSHALDFLGLEVLLINQKSQLKHCSHLILPGVGSFYSGMQHLQKHDLIEAIRQAFLRGTPILGICLGMQLFAQQSEEFGQHEGLKLFAHMVKKLQSEDKTAKLPHVGWNAIFHEAPSLLFKGIPDKAFFYFTHSYAFSDASSNVTSTTRYYEKKIIASVEKNNLFGVQFHPEKSQQYGLELLKNFVNIC
ncbi:MAG: imidazole glycerol phosphate synthase subunit HisH [Proteobacteria bacterium]|nr:imidazole glycerol phosphate synthase subunit HisH [Pseudomonadota bacterium]